MEIEFSSLVSYILYYQKVSMGKPRITPFIQPDYHRNEEPLYQALLRRRQTHAPTRTGKFSNVYGISSNNVTAGQKDYAAHMMQIEKQREEYYRELGTPPGVPR